MRPNLYLTIYLIICFLSSCNTQKSCLNLNLGINVDLEIERCERKLEALNYLEDNSLESYQKLIERLNSGKGYFIEDIVEAYNLDTIINNLHRCPFSDTSFLNEYQTYLDTTEEVSFESSSYIIENELKRNLFQGKIIFAIFLKHSLEKEDAISRMLFTEMNVKQNINNDGINSPSQLIQILVNKNREFIVDKIKMKPNEIHQYLNKKIQFIELDSSSVFKCIKQPDSNYNNVLSNVK